MTLLSFRFCSHFKMMESARVLSIQSHVVSGYVGNKSAVFPMQLLGVEVDFINSVQFSNHTGYKTVKGQILSELELTDLMQGLAENKLNVYSHLLTGYIGSPCFLKEVCSVVKSLKQINPDLIYVCDPVLGDNGKLYVPEELVTLYKTCILPLTTIVTPNLFETELLTDLKIKDAKDVWKAIDVLHAKGCETVVISSADLPEKPTLSVFASTKRGSPQKLSLDIKKLPVNFTGTGDLFASLLLSWMHKSKGNLKESLEKTVSTLQAVLKRTLDSLEGKHSKNVKNLELKLIQSKSDIEEPNVIYEAKIEE